MKLLTAASISAVALLTAGCVVIDADSNDWEAHYASQNDRLYSADISADVVTIRVPASGCTTKDSFSVDVDRHGDNTFEIEFEREREDYCRMMQPDGEELSWTFQELGIPSGATVIIDNPVGR